MKLIFSQLQEKHYEKYIKLINSNITFEYFSKFIQNTLNKNHIILLCEYECDCEKEQNIIGTGTILIEEKLTYGGCKMGHIENIFIHQNYRKKGYGELLVNELIKIAKNNKCYRIDLNCTEELKHFYQKNNFKEKHICMNIYITENFK